VRHKAIRLTSNSVYNYGLFAISVDHIPEGKGVWPAFWLLGTGATWACNGEIDIIEGVNSVSTDPATSQNLSTLHTSFDCPQTEGNCRDGETGIKANWNTCGCSGGEGCPTKGCPKQFADQTSFGNGFNNKSPKGGMFACELTRKGKVQIWYFPDKTKFPNSSTIDTTTWGTPTVSFAACEGFQNLQIIINTTLCGAWAGDKYPFVDGVPALRNQQCQTDLTSGSDLSNAFWTINWLRVYQ
jgi:hypothetical protein